MARQRKRYHVESIEGTELNLVPYLDIMVNLIMFMLLTFEVSAELRIIQFNPPASGSETVIANQTESEEDKPVILTVAIAKDSFAILTDQDEMGTETIPNVADGPNFGELSKRLNRIKNTVTNIDEHLIVIADPSITYKIVVATLDAARETPAGGELFPNVTLGIAKGPG